MSNYNKISIPAVPLPCDHWQVGGYRCVGGQRGRGGDGGVTLGGEGESCGFGGAKQFGISLNAASTDGEIYLPLTMKLK